MLVLDEILVPGRDFKSIDWRATRENIREHVEERYPMASTTGKQAYTEIILANTKKDVRRLSELAGGSPRFVAEIIKKQAARAEKRESAGVAPE